jgi:hypothetical protein
VKLRERSWPGQIRRHQHWRPLGAQDRNPSIVGSSSENRLRSDGAAPVDRRPSTISPWSEPSRCTVTAQSAGTATAVASTSDNRRAGRFAQRRMYYITSDSYRIDPECSVFIWVQQNVIEDGQAQIASPNRSFAVRPRFSLEHAQVRFNTQFRPDTRHVTIYRLNTNII